jgi:hypothetical protein
MVAQGEPALFERTIAVVAVIGAIVVAVLFSNWVATLGVG